MANEVNGRPGGIQHPEEGSPVPEEPVKNGVSVDTSGPEDAATDKLKGADAHGEKGGEDLGRGGD